ncbi:MAG TPA: ATP-binding protein [Anaeromyxobacteraceae bacterium]|nr:ATP-binding protein [Anaeromyxobacteraceae bacterium]
MPLFDLAEKYRQLVVKYERDVLKTSSAALLALAAMRASSTALATFRGSRIVVRNGRWGELTKVHVPWRVCHGATAAEHPGLEALVLAEVRRLASSRRRLATLRCAAAAGEPVVELRLEKLDLGGPVVLAMMTDVTEAMREARELSELRERMMEQQRLRGLGELASGVAHDFNNTLNALALRLARVASAHAGPGDRAEDLRVMTRIISDAADRVRRLQELAATRLDRPAGAIDLAGALLEAAAIARPEIERPGAGPSATVELDLAPLPPVLGDAAEVRHVIVNLLLNARDAMPRGGRIVLGAQPRGDRVVLSVADEGTGIPEAHLSRIFDPFFTTKGDKGTGLGLAIAAHVMQRIGGSICAANRPEGGSEFVLEFRTAASSQAAGEVGGEPGGPSVAPPDRPELRRGGSVLVVDDDADNRDAMAIALRMAGQEVDVTGSGREAMARIAAGRRYDVVLCDLGLGEVDGWEVARHIRQDAPDARVVLVTGWAEQIAADDPRRALVARVLPKPLDLDALLATLADLTRPGAPAGA